MVVHFTIRKNTPPLFSTRLGTRPDRRREDEGDQCPGNPSQHGRECGARSWPSRSGAVRRLPDWRPPRFARAPATTRSGGQMAPRCMSLHQLLPARRGLPGHAPAPWPEVQARNHHSMEESRLTQSLFLLLIIRPPPPPAPVARSAHRTGSWCSRGNELERAIHAPVLHPGFPLEPQTQQRAEPKMMTRSRSR